jgi:hypothetical protein
MRSMRLAVVGLALALLPVGAKSASPPPQAARSGYTTPVLIDDFTSNTIGKNWFVFNRDGGSHLRITNPGSEAFIADDKLTIRTDASGYGSGLQSINSVFAATSTPKHPILSGSRLFQYGYFEARMKFDPKGYTGIGNGWPAFWTGSLFRGFPHSEIDMLEAQPDRWHKSSVITATIHEWVGPGVSKTNGKTEITLPVDFDPAGFNTYGCLWTPTAITFYINDHLAVMARATNPTPIGPGTVFHAPAADYYGGQVLILGTGRNWPVEFKFVHVWQ